MVKLRHLYFNNNYIFLNYLYFIYYAITLGRRYQVIMALKGRKEYSPRLFTHHLKLGQ